MNRFNATSNYVSVIAIAFPSFCEHGILKKHTDAFQNWKPEQLKLDVLKFVHTQILIYGSFIAVKLQCSSTNSKCNMYLHNKIGAAILWVIYKWRTICKQFSIENLLVVSSRSLFSRVSSFSSTFCSMFSQWPNYYYHYLSKGWLLLLFNKKFSVM